jgi:hypothetical protein
MKTHASQLFDELNRKYWRGRLPRYRVIQRATLHGLLGRCRNAHRTILLAPHPSLEALRLTLLHEMCHIKSGSTDPGYDDHGPVFLRKMRRLVRLGETKLVAEDIERYDGTEVQRAIRAARAAGRLGPGIPSRVAVRNNIEEIAYSRSWRGTRWPRVARALAFAQHMTVPQFRRAYPWAEREWKQRKAEARAEILQDERERRAFEAARAANGSTLVDPVSGVPREG